MLSLSRVPDDLFLLWPSVVGEFLTIKRSKVTWRQAKGSRLPSANALVEFFPLCITFDLPLSVRFYRWKEGVQHFREKCLALKVSCHCWESKREENERKQVHLPQVYNPEITVCSEAALTTLWAACASLLISSAPAVQELIWRFSESITLLSGVPLLVNCSHTHAGMKNKCYGKEKKKRFHMNTQVVAALILFKSLLISYISCFSRC